MKKTSYAVVRRAVSSTIPLDFEAFVPGAPCELAPARVGPLDGLRFAVKDLIDVAGFRTGGGNPDWLHAQAPADRNASVVSTLLANGAALNGKTVTDELAFSLEGRNAHYGMPINPACHDRVPGGSSSGSAVAVAANLVDFALGTDTGGSVRVPASFVGVFGMRPTHGAIPLDGVIPFAPSYDTIGWFARDVHTLERIGGVLLPETADLPISQLIILSDAFALTDPAVAIALRQVIAGWPVTSETEIFGGEEDVWRECYRVVQGSEIWKSLGGWIRDAKPRFAEDIATRFADAASITSEQAAAYRDVRTRLAEQMLALTPPNTALIIPTAPCVALKRETSGAPIGEFYRKALTLTAIAGHAGAPQISLPVASVDGCPIGVSIVGAPRCDRALLDLAERLVLKPGHEMSH